MRTIKRLSMTLLTLVMLVVCFSASTLSAYAASCNYCGCTGFDGLTLAGGSISHTTCKCGHSANGHQRSLKTVFDACSRTGCDCNGCAVDGDHLTTCPNCGHSKSSHRGSTSGGSTGGGSSGGGNIQVGGGTRYCNLCTICPGFVGSSTPDNICLNCGHVWAQHLGYTPPRHTHSYGPTSWGAWSYTNSSNHSRTGTATCTSTTGTCSAPTAPRSESQPHTWNWTSEYRTLSNSQHERKRTCAICGGAEWVTLTHDWIEPPPQVVDSTQEIDFSNLRVTVRSLSDTQCEREMVCSECGATQWETRNHNYTTGAQFISVSATQHGRVQTCEYCTHQRNSSLSDHVFETTIVKGTEGHQVVKRCAVCFYTDGSSAMQPHDYGAPQVTESNGVTITTKVCNTCGYRDQVFELAQTTGGNETAIVLSDPMTLDDIKSQARTSSTSPVWKAAIGTEGDFDTAKATSEDYVWHYNKRAYGLSKRPDGLYYIVLLPSYYDARITAKNPDGSSANVSQTKVRAVMRAASSRGRSYTTTSKVPQLGSNGKPTPEYAGAMSAGGKAGMSWGGINGTPPSKQSWSYGGSTYSWVTDSSGRTVTGPNGMPMIQRTDKHTSSSGGGRYNYSGGGGGYYPPVNVHVHSYSYKYKDKTDTQHTKTTIVCGGSCGSSDAVENHNYGNWTYTDLGPELHRAERVCKNCGHVDTKIEAHNDANNDHRCDQCTRVISVVITWHWYDEHTPVTDTTVQRYYRGLVHPPLRGRMDYKFIGWYTVWGGENNGGEEWPQGRDYPYSSPTHLYASWQAIIERVDVVAPIITVTRNPADINTPVGEVSLTITAVDPQGNDHELPLQIEGEAEWHPSPWVITVDKSKTITIVARDTEGNVREFVVDVNNVDTLPPTIVGLSSNVKGWTKNPVTITATVHDDQKLAALPYQWEFTPNSTGTATLGQWTSVNTLSVAEAGKVRVQVRDTVGNAVWSDYFEVNNIDTIAPQLSTESPYTLDTEETVPSDRGVTITLNIRDIPDPVTGLSSGLSPDPIKWQDETVFGKNKSKTVYANGVYEVTLMDAVGNTSIQRITIGNISTDNPTVNNFYAISEDGKTITGSASTGDWFRAPYTLVVDASFGAAGPADKPYSWDGGKTWTSLNTHEVTTNGEYTVLIKDAVGTIVEQSITLDNTDATKPTVGMYLFKGLPEDWTDPNFVERDYVWKMRIEAEDLGSGLKDIHTQWDDKHYTEADLPIIFDVKTPGTYHVTVTDNAGNVTQAEKVAQWTDLGENVDGPNPNVPVVSPEPGTGGAAPNGTGSDIGSGLGPNGKDWGTAGYPYNANLEDLVFGPEGAYNTATGEYTPYPADMKGIPVNFNAHVTRNKWATAYVTFNGTKYPATFAPVPTPFNTGYTNGISPVKGTGDPLAGYAFIPITAITSDIKNARITVTVMEWNDSSCTGEPNRVGTENFYTSAQVSKPVVSYVYNQVTEELAISATSAIAGVKKIEYSLDGGTTWHDYDGNPVVLTGLVSDGDTIVMKATDTLGNSTTLTVAVADLGLNGGAGGGSLPADDTTNNPLIGADGNAINSHHSSNRAADIYIIGGTRSNTTQVPSTTVFQYLLPTPVTNP